MRWLICVTLALAATSSCGSGLDAHAKAACATVKQIDSGADTGLLDTVEDEFKATGEAQKSSIAGLRAAANKKSFASSFSPDNPLYENPGDVEFNAVAAWCRQHA